MIKWIKATMFLTAVLFPAMLFAGTAWADNVPSDRMLSVNLAILNLLPVPILDGGHLVFLAIEAVRGRALSLETRARASQVGLIFILALMVWALTSDFLRISGN